VAKGWQTWRALDMAKWSKSRFVGVRFWESDTRKFKGKADRCFIVRYKAHGRTISETVGWASHGVTAQYASNIRGEIVQNIRQGQGFQSIKEKGQIEKARRDAELVEREAREIENMPFRVLAEKYIEWAKDNKKTWWVDEGAYRKHLNKELGHLPLKDISVIKLERIKRNLQKKGLSERSVQCYLNVIKHMFNKGMGWGLYEGNNPVTETAKTNKKFLKIADNRRLRFLNWEEADILLDELQGRSPQLHDISLLSLHAGLRAGEIFNLTWQDVDVTHEIIAIRNPKNSETRQAYMTPQLKRMFCARGPKKARNSDLIFKDRNGGKIREVSTTFERVVKHIGFNKGMEDRQNKLVFHSLRHTFASWLALQGETLLTIMELMGHRDIKMTMRYAHLIPDQKRKAVLQLAKKQSKTVVELKKKRKKK
jgi:integrase